MPVANVFERSFYTNQKTTNEPLEVELVISLSEIMSKYKKIEEQERLRKKVEKEKTNV